MSRGAKIKDSEGNSKKKGKNEVKQTQAQVQGFELDLGDPTAL
jgi:hypothetical protein